jgi:hypothetical protein
MMRWFLFLILVFAVLWYIRGMEEVRPQTVEETFIGDQVKVLRKAENFEKSYLEATDEHKKQMEEQLEKDSGGGSRD